MKVKELMKDIGFYIFIGIVVIGILFVFIIKPAVTQYQEIKLRGAIVDEYLDPCSKCGSKDLFVATFDGFSVSCEICNYRVKDSTLKKTIEKWNTSKGE